MPKPTEEMFDALRRARQAAAEIDRIVTERHLSPLDEQQLADVVGLAARAAICIDYAIEKLHQQREAGA